MGKETPATVLGKRHLTRMLSKCVSVGWNSACMTSNATLMGVAGSTLVITSIKRLYTAKQTVCVKKCYADFFPGSVISFLHTGSEMFSSWTVKQRGGVPG